MQVLEDTRHAVFESIQEGTSMTIQAAAIPDVGADIRWREWQARGAESDRRTAARTHTVTLLIAAAAIAWLVIQLI